MGCSSRNLYNVLRMRTCNINGTYLAENDHWRWKTSSFAVIFLSYCPRCCLFYIFFLAVNELLKEMSDGVYIYVYTLKCIHAHVTAMWQFCIIVLLPFHPSSLTLTRCCSSSPREYIFPTSLTSPGPSWMWSFPFFALYSASFLSCLLLTLCKSQEECGNKRELCHLRGKM